MADLYEKISKKVDKILQEELQAEFDKHIPEIKEILINSYRLNLVAAVTDPESRTNPGLPRYIEAFEQALEDFEFINVTDAGFTIKMPDMEKFKFNTGTLKVIENVLEGTTGIYVEIDAEQFEKMYGKPPINLEAFDDTARKKDMVYIIRYTHDVRQKEREAFGKQELVRYPFSNTPPIDIFDDADAYVQENIGDWMDTALKKALKRVEKEYK